MFHVVTVHWRDDAWIEPQRRFMTRHFPPGTAVYAALHGVPRQRFAEFTHAVDLPGSHPEKLNALAETVAERADPSDVLVFIDGDAVPIAPIDRSILDVAPLVAVRRDENLCDPQPHPCFCVTTVGFWREIVGDWNRGYEWTNRAGERVTDVGGNLLGILTERGEHWRPLLRSNTQNPHPLWFGIYGGVVYHHGAGFRRRVARVDGLPRDHNPRLAASDARIPASVPLLGSLERSLRFRRARRRRDRYLAREVGALDALADEIFAELKADDEFWRRFVS